MPRRTTQEEAPIVAPDEKTTGDLGQAQLQERRDEDEAKGHWGEKPPGPDNSEFSLKTGPSSPGALEQAVTSAELRLKELKGDG